MSKELSAKAKAIDYLSRREYSRLELKRKLLQKGYLAEEVELALEDLVQHGWQSDTRFSESFIHLRARQGYGPIKIGLELRQRGVAEEIVSDLLQRDSQSWQSQLSALWIKKKQHYQGDRQRLQRYFLQRGYQLDCIIELIKNSDGDDDVNVDESN